VRKALVRAKNMPVDKPIRGSEAKCCAMADCGNLTVGAWECTDEHFVSRPCFVHYAQRRQPRFAPFFASRLPSAVEPFTRVCTTKYDRPE
jgi:hypothetical protein